MIFRLITIAVIVFPFYLKAQQSSRLGHYFLDTYLINPAYSGQEGAKIMAYYRNQWVSTEGSPETHAFTLQGKLKNHPLGFGLTAVNDVQNVIGRTSFTYSNSYKIFLGLQHKLYFGLSLHLLHTKIHFNKLSNFDDTESILSRLDNSTTIEGSFGFGYQFRNFNLSFSSDQIFQNGIKFRDISGYDEATLRLLRIYTGYFSYKPQLTNNIGLIQTSLLRVTQGLPAEYELQSIMNYKNQFFLGGSFSSGSRIGILVGLRFEERYILNYRGEDHLENRGPINGMTHEIAIGFRFSEKKNSGTIKNDQTSNLSTLPDDFDKQKFNELLIQYEALKNEIEKLKLENDIEAQEEALSGFDKYYVVTGTFSTLRNAKLYQKVFFRETGIETKIEKEDRKGYFLVYSSVVGNPKSGKKKIKKLLRGKSRGMLMGSPWLYKKNH